MKNKLKILVVSEFHILNTGYSTYYKNICEALHNAGHEVSELASYGNENLPEHIRAAKKCPWSVYLNIPNASNQQRWDKYNHAKAHIFDAEFGSWDFENVVLDCMPDVVISIRDHWYDKFILESPLAKYYKVILSPTVDSRPQKNDWLDTFQKVDALTFYTKWSEDWLKTQYNQPNIVGHIPPGPNPEYKPIFKSVARKKLGLPEGNKILLTVMRNQGRKMYPNLFEAFSQIKDKSIFLYCHTHFEDRGWDLPKLIAQNGITDRVYFSYKCKECFDISADLLKSDNKCAKCKGSKEICSVQDGASNEELNYVYNSADLYIQWANSEGFGIPIIEAAATGLKVISVDFSAPEDIVDKTTSFALSPLSLQREMGTLCNRAIPDTKTLVELLNNPDTWVYDKKEVVEKLKSNYSWAKTGEKWVALVESQIPKDNWAESPVLKHPPSFDDIKNLNTFDFVKVCVLSVLQDESVLGTYLHGEALEHLETGFYIPEDKKTSLKGNVQKAVTKEMVYHKFYNMLENKINWERKKNAKLQELNNG